MNFPNHMPPYQRFIEQCNQMCGPAYKEAHKMLRETPEKFTDTAFSDRDRALIHAPEVPGVSYINQSCMNILSYAEPGAPLGQTKMIQWNEDNDAKCRAMLADVGQVVYHRDGHVVVPLPAEKQKSINVKVQICGKSGADFELGTLTANGSCPGDIRIFKGTNIWATNTPDIYAWGRQCDGMIIRNAVASTVSLYGTTLDKVWDILLISSEQYDLPWCVCAMKEVDEPGGRVIQRVASVNGVWGTSPYHDGVVTGADVPQPKVDKKLANQMEASEAIMNVPRYEQDLRASLRAHGMDDSVPIWLPKPAQ